MRAQNGSPLPVVQLVCGTFQPSILLLIHAVHLVGVHLRVCGGIRSIHRTATIAKGGPKNVYRFILFCVNTTPARLKCGVACAFIGVRQRSCHPCRTCPPAHHASVCLTNTCSNMHACTHCAGTTAGPSPGGLSGRVAAAWSESRYDINACSRTLFNACICTNTHEDVSTWR